MKKRILMVHNFYQIGGGEHTVFNNELELLRENGHFVSSYTRDNSTLKGNPLKLLTVPFSTLFSIKTFLEVKKIIKEQNIEIVHCHNTFPLISPSVYYAAWACKVKVVQTMHNFRFICANGLLYRDGKICEDCLNGRCRAIGNGCYRDSKLQTIPVVLMQKLHRAMGTYRKLNYIFLAEFNKNKMVPYLKPTGLVAVKANFVKKVELIKGPPVEKDKFIFVGRLDEYKGIEFILDFFKNHSQYKIVIYGGGKLEEKVKLAAEKHSNIKYMGFKPHEEMEKDWQTSCALIFSSLLYEGLPMTIAESLARGVPIVCTNIGNAADIVKEEYAGAHFTMQDINGLEVAIEKTIKNRDAYSKNALKEASKYLQEENYIQLCRIYDSLH